MTRTPDTDLARLKQSVSLLGLARKQGRPMKNTREDYVLRCRSTMRKRLNVISPAKTSITACCAPRVGAGLVIQTEGGR